MTKTTILKRILVLIMALTVLTPSSVFANPANQLITVTIDGVQVRFENTQPQIVDGKTLVPARVVFEHLGFDVQ